MVTFHIMGTHKANVDTWNNRVNSRIFVVYLHLNTLHTYILSHHILQDFSMPYFTIDYFMMSYEESDRGEVSERDK